MIEKKYKRNRIGKQEAINLYNSGWWAGKTDRELAIFQMLTEELCMPFDRFHEALTKALGRPVWTHELGLNWQGLMEELIGGKPAPTMREIMELIPKEKRLAIIIKAGIEAEILKKLETGEDFTLKIGDKKPKQDTPAPKEDTGDGTYSTSA